MKKGLITGVVAGVILLTGCTLEDKPGSPAVYARMDAETDCATLQAEFDWADFHHQHGGGTVSTSYMEYADKRMREVGCY